jgi:uncharacterized protein YecT (DUF1311 family)
MNIIKYFFTIAAVLLAISNACAEESYSPTFNSCVKVSKGATDSLVACYGAETKLQDSRLNSNYKKAMAALAAPQKQKLLDAQRQWIKFRDADCGMYYSLTGGTIDILNGSDCELSTTKKRADDLSWIAENAGN